MNTKLLNKILIAAVVILAGFIFYQNFIADDKNSNEITYEETQLWTCGMHPDIISDEPGNCPICGMKLTPVKNTQSSSSDGDRKILYWVAPMDPNEVYDSPGKSKMGMDLVPVYADEASQAGVVTIDPTVQQNMNVKLTTVEKRALNPSIITNAIFTIDERKEFQITARVSGWIEKLLVNYTGQKVSKGDKLLEIYSPELVSAQQEYLTALKYKSKVISTSLSSSGDELIENAYRKLTLLNFTPAEIMKLENSGKVRTTIPLYSPVNGTVLMKNVVEGEKIKAGQNLLHIADLATLWIKADIYESDISKIELGDNVEVEVDAFPNQNFNGKVSFIYPTINSKTRTTQIRIDVQNTNEKLKPAMLARVTIFSDQTEILPVIPESAVIRSGEKNVAVQYLGGGKFKPVAIELGNYADGFYQVLSGLKEGSKVVTSAQFLIDSESSLKTAMKNFSKQETDDKELKGESKPSDHNSEMNTKDEHNHSNQNEYGIDSPLIRTGEIDVKSIDKNGDGKLFECPMDWNIIADEYQRCPACEMKMKEYTIEEVKKNLDEYGYEHK
ncbi:MAG: efflux RND transporter periplasmic adaptor subunit [Melioribacteraceae bacterium]|nr:efflux RND transporter periplasmic adaptor subunit [Melioribacteraceae bacterium]